MDLLNRLLRGFNLRLETLTADRLEAQRLAAIEKAGGFDQPVYAVPPQFLNSAHQFLLEALPQYRARFDSFRQPETNDVGYQYKNGFYFSPDTEILYTMVRVKTPRRIVEIGCGNSTKIIHQALKDGGIQCEHVAIDPYPRLEISRLVHRMMREPIEHAKAAAVIGALEAGDILFIDTSHESRPANDVAYIYGQLLARVRPGVIVHVHDIFLPYEYPKWWTVDLRLPYGEQYIVQAIVMNTAQWETLWPGYYLQRTLPGFEKHFPHGDGRMAQSLWLRKIA